MVVRSPRRVLLLAAAAVLACSASPSYARTEMTATRVSYADLNLSSDAGVSALYKRVRRAARSVCETTRSASRQLRARAQACIDQATQRAVEDIDVATLTAYAARQRNARHIAER